MIIISDYNNVINIVLKYGNKSDLNQIFSLQLIYKYYYLRFISKCCPLKINSNNKRMS